MKVLVACEESQRVCIAFREKGHEAYSCDIEPCSGGRPEWHIQQDVLPLLDGRCAFRTADGTEHAIAGRWDLIIAHPPCTFLTVSGNRWFNKEQYGESAVQRERERDEAIKFFLRFTRADCERIAIENPIGVMTREFGKPTQIIQPYYFGDREKKATCLWLKGLQPLEPTQIIPKEEREESVWLARFGGKQYAWNDPETAKLRSKTFPRIANAMAEQWGAENDGIEWHTFL